MRKILYEVPHDENPNDARAWTHIEHHLFRTPRRELQVMLQPEHADNLRKNASYLDVHDREDGGLRIQTNPEGLKDPEHFARAFVQFGVAHGDTKTLAKHIDEDQWGEHMETARNMLVDHPFIPEQQLMRGASAKLHMRLLLQTMMQKLDPKDTLNTVVDVEGRSRVYVNDAMTGRFEGAYCRFVSQKKKFVESADVVMAMGLKPDSIYLFKGMTDYNQLPELIEQSRIARLRSFLRHGEEGGMDAQMFFVAYQELYQSAAADDDAYVIKLPLMKTVKEFAEATSASLQKGTYRSFQEGLVGRKSKKV